MQNNAFFNWIDDLMEFKLQRAAMVIYLKQMLI